MPGSSRFFGPDMVADLHADMPGLHASRQLGAGGIDVLQRHLAKRLQPPISAAAHFQRSIVKDLRNFQCLFGRPVDTKTAPAWRRSLADRRPAGPDSSSRTAGSQHDLLDAAELAVAQHDHAFPAAQVLEPGPVRRAEARREIGPRFGKEMGMDVDGRHAYDLPGWTVPQFLHRRSSSLP